ncbi:MAG: hypothetical protein LDL24_06865 [Treponema sp.]|nr:hypothetical protein [Treponema sp.]
MKQLKVLSAIVILTVGLAMGAAAQTTASITLQGTIPAILKIIVTPEAGINSLDLTQNLSMKIATAVEISNKRAGYTVTVSSANAQTAGTDAPFFKGAASDNTDTLPYSISYGGTTAAFSSGVATVSTSAVKTSATGTVKDVVLNFNGSSLFPNEDTYSDTLTFTITAN